MAGQRENDEVEREIAEAFAPVARLRPSHRIVSMWRDLEACLENIRRVEFLLGYAPEKPVHINHEFVQVQLQDARAALGTIALALSEEAENA
ncbi:hypothetical protein M0722_01505 [Microbacterium sp. KSW4-16]|uniref:hypothetical protein n=1 Tax=Microbacterium aurugineum TaxID=2851642 RepID=UPI0020C0FAF7|nr:hypothetical protein [Microbacterium aurugineum]MCK8465858.1 hypothetical protein [Microbacterium aurugineum]